MWFESRRGAGSATNRHYVMRQKPLTHFDIRPGIGALPVTFGMHRDEVHELLGATDATKGVWGGLGYRIGYDDDSKVIHFGFGPGPVVLSVEGRPVWSAESHSDPNSAFLALDPKPVRRGDLLIFVQLGVQTSGYRYGDRGNGIVNVWPLDQIDRLARGRRVAANMNRYYRAAPLPHNQPTMNPALGQPDF